MRSIRESVTSPSQFILARVDAFKRCDFGFIFDSYHRDSNFRRQFADRDEYIRYGWANLGKEFRGVPYLQLCDYPRRSRG